MSRSRSLHFGQSAGEFGRAVGAQQIRLAVEIVRISLCERTYVIAAEIERIHVEIQIVRRSFVAFISQEDRELIVFELFAAACHDARGVTLHRRSAHERGFFLRKVRFDKPHLFLAVFTLVI